MLTVVCFDGLEGGRPRGVFGEAKSTVSGGGGRGGHGRCCSCDCVVVVAVVMAGLGGRRGGRHRCYFRLQDASDAQV